MNNLLREQLLKTGLVSKDQAKQTEKQLKSKTHQVVKEQRQRQKHHELEKPVDTESAAYLAAKVREEEIQRAKELNRQRELEKKQRELYSQARQLVECYHVNDPEADSIYHFVEGKIVKPIYVTSKQHRQLATGQLGIVKIAEQYYLVPVVVVEKLRERAPEIIVCIHQLVKEEISPSDPYAAYPVPDELVW